MQRILLIDDSVPNAQGLRHDFVAAGYSDDVAGSGDVGLTAVRLHPPDLVILDRARADSDGVCLLQRLHDTAEQVPVLLVGRDPTPTDQVRWLDSGADDCVALTQPFEVVLARTRALLRRQSPPPQRLAYTDLVIDAASHTVCRGPRQIVLTRLEFRLLYEFVRHAEQILSKALLRDRVWGADFGSSQRLADTGYAVPTTNTTPDVRGMTCSPAICVAM